MNIVNSLRRAVAWSGNPLIYVPNNMQQMYVSTTLAHEQHQAAPLKSTRRDEMHTRTPPTLRSNVEAPNSDHAKTLIGTIHLSNGSKDITFKCTEPKCHQISFTRWPDLDRHRKAVHRTGEELYWCDEPNCKRSRLKKTRPFYRKDKRTAHVRKMHGGLQRPDVAYFLE